MKRVVIVALVVLAGCSSKAEKAEEQYRIVEKTSQGFAEKCRAGRAVADAYLEEQNADKYALWNSLAESYCGLAN